MHGTSNKKAAKVGLSGEGGRAGGEKLKEKRQKESKHKQEGVQGKGKGEAVEEGRRRPLSKGADKVAVGGKRPPPVSDVGGKAKKKQRREKVVGAGGGSVKIGIDRNKRCPCGKRR
jgi:hypothetical protein